MRLSTEVSAAAKGPAYLPRPEIHVIETKIPGCFELRFPAIKDTRGYFAKIFHRPLWEDLGLCTQFEEEYLTHSVAGALRGLHLQVPPMQQDKLVLCLRGQAWDVALDLRHGSPTYGQHISRDLDSAASISALYLPAGVAHGFCVTGSEALFYYKVSSLYSPEHDTGVHWNSADIPWPLQNPIVSPRDQTLPPLADFRSPFNFKPS